MRLFFLFLVFHFDMTQNLLLFSLCLAPKQWGLEVGMEQEGIFPSLFPAVRKGCRNIPWQHPELLKPLQALPHPISSPSTKPRGAEQTNLRLASVLGGITRLCFFGVQINFPPPPWAQGSAHKCK